MERIDYLKINLLDFYKRNFDFQEVYVKNNRHQSSRLLITCTQIGYFFSGALIILLTTLSAGEFYSYTCWMALLAGSTLGLKCGSQTVNKTLYLPSEKFEQRRNRKLREFLSSNEVTEVEKKFLADYFEYIINRDRNKPVKLKVLLAILGFYITFVSLAINVFANGKPDVFYSILIICVIGVCVIIGMWFTINAIIESFMNRNVTRMRNIMEALRYS
ncbi:hypothetical protein [Olivibacter jilunii]|uniref:hypothetical protein n=1 Tax=Olivibacter jilunii TaxID=985016 RepID=UPI003F18A328